MQLGCCRAVAILILLSIALAATTTPEVCNPPVQFFLQKVDHGKDTASSGKNSTTFPQRYQLNTDHWQPGGPLLLFLSPEGDQMTCIETNILPEWAPQLGAAVAGIEHRFFGLSLPSNVSDVIEKYQTLTLDNILGDILYFSKYVKQMIPGMEDVPVITFGGSYAAHLSALMRLNHPDDIFGSVGWAAPMTGFGTTDSNPGRYNFVTYASNVYQDQSAEAASKIQHAFTVLGEKMSSKSYEEIAHNFNLCEAPKNETDITTFYRGIVLISYLLNAEFSYGYPLFPHKRSNSLQLLINQTLELSDPMEILNASVQLNYPPAIYPCMPIAADAGADAGISIATFDYIGCEVYPLETYAVPEGTIFLPWPGAMDERVEHCKTDYNLTVPTGEEHMKRYNFTPRDIANAQRILYTSGEFDPVSGTSPLQLLGNTTTDRNASRTLFIPQAAHGEDSFPSSLLAKPHIAHSQDVELQILKDWLGIA